MGWIGEYQQVCYSTLNWYRLDHASLGPQLRVQHKMLTVPINHYVIVVYPDLQNIHQSSKQ